AAGVGVLGRHVEGQSLQAHLHHLVDDGHEQDEPGTVAVATRVEDGARAAAEPEDDGALVLAQRAHEGADEEEGRHQHHEQQQSVHRHHGSPPLPAFTTLRVRPRTSTTRTAAPSSRDSPSVTAFQISPWRVTCPSGASAPRATPTSPTSPAAPSMGRRVRARSPAPTTKRKRAAVVATDGAI